MVRYAITDRALFGGSLDLLLQRILQIAGGLEYLQIRERDLSAAELERFTARVIAGLASLPKRPQVLVNHRPDIAMATGADGVHLRSATSGELLPEEVFAVYAKAALPRPVVSVSCHSLPEIAMRRNAGLILFGPVFEKVESSVPEVAPGSGLELLRQACQAAAPVPVFALGGVTRANQHECLQSGAAGVAGIRLFFANPNPRQAVK